MLTIISQMAALFILIIVGYGAAKLKIIDGRFSQQLSVFVINISSPCLIVSSVMGDISPDKDLILPVLAIGCVTYAFFVAVAMLLSRIITKNKDMQGIYGFMLTFGNVGFIGYPLSKRMWKEPETPPKAVDSPYGPPKGERGRMIRTAVIFGLTVLSFTFNLLPLELTALLSAIACVLS